MTAIVDGLSRRAAMAHTALSDARRTEPVVSRPLPNTTRPCSQPAAHEESPRYPQTYDDGVPPSATVSHDALEADRAVSARSPSGRTGMKTLLPMALGIA